MSDGFWPPENVARLHTVLDYAAFKGLRVMAPLAPLGFAQYLDGVTTHGYYDVGGSSPSHPPRHTMHVTPTLVANGCRLCLRGLTLWV